jgi:hypothetical protein
MAMHARVKTTSTDRCRRSRERRRRGAFCITLELDGQILNFLERMQWLKETDACDTRKIAQAIALLLSDSARI